MNPYEAAEGLLGDPLTAAAESGSRNRITPTELREWVLEYLREWDDECARFPEVAEERHWNLWMADHDGEKDAVFVGMIFGLAGIDVVCGRGDSHSIRGFCESDFPESLDRVLPALKKRFPMCQPPVVLSRAVAETWLARSFPPVDSDPRSAAAGT